MKLLNFLLLCSLLATTGCNSTNLANSIDGTLARAAGNKPPAFFKVANVETMKDYVFNMNGYSIAMPTAKEIDFRKHDGWMGLTHYNKDITLYLEGFYHISVSTFRKSQSYTEKERELENGTRKFRPRRTKPKGDIININTHIEHHGNEKYPCIVSESLDRFKRYRIGYTCYKFNPSRTKAKRIHIRLTYTRPNDPTLVKEYTYKDLQNRAKRMLDSLYIKDGW
ncbi:MAG TPA: hypothetical protein VIN02_04485 [Sulfurovum sp.]